MDDDTVRTVFRTFRSAFPQATVWQSQAGDFVLLGTKERLAPDFQVVARRMAYGPVAQSLGAIGVDGMLALLCLQTLTEDALDQYAGRGILNTNAFPYLEFAAPRAFFSRASAVALRQADERGHLVAPDLLVARYLGGRTLLPSEARSMAGALAPASQLSTDLLAMAQRKDPDPKAAGALVAAMVEKRRPSMLGAFMARAVVDERWPVSSVRRLFKAALNDCVSSRNAFGPGSCDDAVRLGRHLTALDVPIAQRREDLSELGRALLIAHEFVPAAETYRAAIGLGTGSDPKLQAALLAGESVALLRKGAPADAAQAAREALALDPTRADATHVATVVSAMAPAP
jgi:hypothetical protein